ncbi:DUF2142 domain-containing protein [Candidatus Saccharibacteria bacterium]|nr:DUF2142 domain-containing protein [Candidatus Saccharibacteria bacterium]
MKKLKTFIKEVFSVHKIPFLVLGALNLLLFLYTIKSDDVKHIKIAIFALFGFILLEFSLLLVYHFLKEKKHFPLEKIFLFLAIPLGLLQVFITPFNQLPDELVHIFRTYDISDGHLVSTKNEEGHYRTKISKTYWDVLNNGQGDSNYYKKVAKDIFAPTSEEKWGWDFDNAATYHSLAYAPQVTGVAAGKFVRLPIVLTMYLGRIFALAAFIAVIYFAIKLTPKYKEFFVLFALLPMSLQQGMAYSADSVLIAFCFLLIALAIKYAYGSDKTLSKKQITALYVVTAVVSCVKHLAYLPLGLLFMLIPAKKFGSAKKKYLHLFLIVVLCVALEFIWSNMQDKSVVAAATTEAEALPAYSFIKFIIVSFAMIFGVRTEELMKSTVGTNISYNNFSTPSIIYVYLFIGLVAVMILRSSEKLVLKKYDKLIFCLTPIILSLAFYYAATYQWNFRSETTISGIQGRYYLPFLTLIPFIAHHEKKNATPLKVDYVFYFAIFSNCCILALKMLHNL